LGERASLRRLTGGFQKTGVTINGRNEKCEPALWNETRLRDLKGSVPTNCQHENRGVRKEETYFEAEQVKKPGGGSCVKAAGEKKKDKKSE